MAISLDLHHSGFDELMPWSLATATVDRLLHRAHWTSEAAREEMPTVAEFMNEVPKTVVSRSTPHVRWENTAAADGEDFPAPAIRRDARVCLSNRASPAEVQRRYRTVAAEMKSAWPKGGGQHLVESGSPNMMEEMEGVTSGDIEAVQVIQDVIEVF